MCQVRRLQSVIIASYKVTGIGLQNATFGLRSATGVKKCENNYKVWCDYKVRRYKRQSTDQNKRRPLEL